MPLFTKKAPDQVLAETRANHAKKKATLDQLLRDIDSASIEVAEYEEAPTESKKKLASLISKLPQLKGEVEITGRAVIAAEAKNAEAVRRAEFERIEQCWKKVEALQPKAIELAKQLDQHCAHVASIHSGLQKICAEAFEAIPEVKTVTLNANNQQIEKAVRLTDGTDLLTSNFGIPKLAQALKLALRRNGLFFAATWLDDERKIPSMVDTVAEGFGWALKLRNDSKDRGNQ